MSEVLHYLLALGAGFALGLGFFGGLWWTVQRVARRNSAVWLFPVSSLVRVALLLAGIWWVAHGDVVRLLLCVAGWLTARQLVLRRFGPVGAKGDDACT